MKIIQMSLPSALFPGNFTHCINLEMFVLFLTYSRSEHFVGESLRRRTWVLPDVHDLRQELRRHLALKWQQMRAARCCRYEGIKSQSFLTGTTNPSREPDDNTHGRRQNAFSEDLIKISFSAIKNRSICERILFRTRFPYKRLHIVLPIRNLLLCHSNVFSIRNRCAGFGEITWQNRDRLLLQFWTCAVWTKPAVVLGKMPIERLFKSI